MNPETIRLLNSLGPENLMVCGGLVGVFGVTFFGLMARYKRLSNQPVHYRPLQPRELKREDMFKDPIEKLARHYASGLKGGEASEVLALGRVRADYILKCQSGIPILNEYDSKLARDYAETLAYLEKQTYLQEGVVDSTAISPQTLWLIITSHLDNHQ